MTSLGLFWMAFWAFGFGYVISSMIQVFVTEKKMKDTMGEEGAQSIGLGTFFGFLSSSCSFAALSTTRALFAKGAGLIPSLAFLLASTNLVIELGILISVFLSWQFVVGEYLGGILLILLMTVVVKLTLSQKFEEKARKHAQNLEVGDGNGDSKTWWQKFKSWEGWKQVAHQYFMEWDMVWKDVTIGFTLAGIISVFVPRSFFEFLFLSSAGGSPSFLEVLLQTLAGPLAAFFTFIGSMGNIPLAAVLFANGVSFAGIMAFIFSDLIVFPVLRIQAQYYGWKMALYIFAVFLSILVAASLILHYGFSAFDLLPDNSVAGNISDREYFKIDSTFYLNILFGMMSVVAFCSHFRNRSQNKKNTNGRTWGEILLISFAGLSLSWLLLGFGIGSLMSF